MLSSSSCSGRDAGGEIKCDSVDRVNGVGLSHAALRGSQQLFHATTCNQIDLGWVNGTNDRESHGGRLGKKGGSGGEVAGRTRTNW